MMSVQTSSSRPASKSVGAAVGGILLTLAIFATVMLSFLIAPLVVLIGAYFVYMMFRGRGKKRDTAALAPGAPTAAGPHQPAPPSAPHGFGAGAS